MLRLAEAWMSLKLRNTRAMDKDRWVGILRAAGLDDAAMRRCWHVEFESAAPAAHQDFLESLGLSKTEAARIRRWSSGESLGYYDEPDAK